MTDTPQTYDLLIHGDRIIDPATGLDGPGVVGIRNGRIAALEGPLSSCQADQVHDATGQIVCPGLIDLHVHVYEWVTNFGLPPDDAGVDSGATTIVDQGSAGPWTVGGFDAYIASPARTDVRSFVSANLAGALKGGMEGTTLHNPDMTRIDAIVEVAQRYPELVRGIKSHGEVGGLSHWGTEVLETAVEAGNQADLPLYIHTGELFPVNEADRPNPASVLEAIVPVVRPGDTLAHVYSNMPDGIMGPNETVPPAVFEALDKGIHFDIGHGINFSFDIARRMMDAGVLPNTISSDVHGDFNRFHDENGLDYSLCGAMNKMWALGMELPDVIRRTTLNPAQIMRSESDIGTLGPGSVADVTILDRMQGDWLFRDMMGETIMVEERLVPAMVVRSGRIMEPTRRLLVDLADSHWSLAAQ